MKVLSVKQPWAYLLCSGIKDIENRTWKLPERYKGKRVLIHVSSKPDKEPYMLLNDEQINIIGDRIMDVVASYHTVSAIIGSVVFTDCVINHQSVFAEKTMIEQMECPNCGCEESEYFGDGEHKCDRCKHTWWENENRPIYNWVLSEPILYENPIENIKGKLSFWNYDEIEEVTIECPECGTIQPAVIDCSTKPFNTYIHDCKNCGYLITESDWNEVKEEAL